MVSFEVVKEAVTIAGSTSTDAMVTSENVLNAF